MSVEGATAIRPEVAAPVAVRRGDLRIFVRRVLRTRGAGFGLVVTLLTVFLALTADVVSPYSPAAPAPPSPAAATARPEPTSRH